MGHTQASGIRKKGPFNKETDAILPKSSEQEYCKVNTRRRQGEHKEKAVNIV